jgi:hypothetical protein
MGYEQEVTFVFTKPVNNEEEAKKFETEIKSRLGDEVLESGNQETHFDSGEASVSVWALGRYLYDFDDDDDDDVLLGPEDVSAKKLTRELGCRLEISYQGEEPSDKDRRTYENGKLVEKWEYVEVNVMNNQIKEFKRIIDEIRKKGCDKEAQQLYEVVMRIAAHYLFS